MDILFVIACAILIISMISDAIMAIRTYMYQKRWDDEKQQLIRNDPAITAAELCAAYVDFCAENHCLVEY